MTRLACFCSVESELVEIAEGMNDRVPTSAEWEDVCLLLLLLSKLDFVVSV